MTELRKRLIEDLRIRGRSDRTIAAYVHWIAELAKHYRRSPDQLIREDLRGFVLHLIEQRRLSPSSVRQAVAAIRFFYRFTLDWRREQYDVAAPQKQQTLPEILSRSEVGRIIAAVPNPKYCMMLILAYSSGLRLGELVQLEVADLDLERCTIRVRQGKGQKDRLVPLAVTLLPRLRTYCTRLGSSKLLFPSEKADRPVHETAVQKQYQWAKLRAGIVKRGGIHGLRHAYATHLVEAGTPLHRIQQFLGHRSITTTMRYLHLTHGAAGVTVASPWDLEDRARL